MCIKKKKKIKHEIIENNKNERNKKKEKQ